MSDEALEPAKTKRRGRGLIPLTPQSLPLWNDRARGAPNALVRSALFTCADKRKPRRVYDREVIVTLAGQKISYSGKELRQDDLTVWLQVVHLARMQPVGDQVEVSAHSLSVAVGWGSSGEAYKRLRDSIARMREGSVWVERPGGKGFSGNLLMRLEWTDAGSRSRERWKLYLDPNILDLFKPDAYTLLNGEDRLALTPLAQWLYGFYSTHETPFPYKIATLFNLCGSTASSLSGFKRNLVEALGMLKERKLIYDFQVESKSKTVQIFRRAPLSLIEAGAPMAEADGALVE